MLLTGDMDSGAGVPADGQTAVHNELTGSKTKNSGMSVASIPELFFMGRETAGLSELSETLGKAVSVQEIPTVVFIMTKRQAFDSVFCCSCFLPRRPFPACLK